MAVVNGFLRDVDAFRLINEKALTAAEECHKSEQGEGYNVLTANPKTPNKMSTLLTKQVSQWLMISAVPLMLLCVSCTEEEMWTSEIQFPTILQNITEGDQVKIVMQLNKPASRDGEVTVTLDGNAVYSEHYTTSKAPTNKSINLSIPKGAKSVEFTLSTVDNSTYEGTRVVLFTLSGPTDGFMVGPKSSLIVSINDDEGPAVVNFAVNEATILEEDAGGIAINLPLSSAAKGTGSITLSISAGDTPLNSIFTVDKAVNNNSITLPITENQALVTLKVVPVSNDLFSGNRTVQFTINAVSGVVEKGNSLIFQLTIVDDELPSIANFALNGGVVNEDDASGIKVNIPFSGPARGTGKLVVSFASSLAKYGTHFTTSKAKDDGSNSITFDVSSGETDIEFAVLPMKDFTVTGNMEINFTIASVEGVVLKGNKLTYSLTIINSDAPAKVQFAEASGEVVENNATGIVVNLPFSGPAPGGGTIKLTWTSVMSYGSSFTTEPPASNNSILLPYDKNDMSKSFKVKPVNNSNCWSANYDNLITWKIDVITGGALEKGDVVEYVLALKDDEEVNLISFEKEEDSINENNSSGVVVKLNFARPLETNSTVALSTDWYGHEGKLVTSPPYNYGCYWSYCYDPFLNAAQGAGSSSFTVTPIDNGVKGGNYIAHFTVYSYSGNSCLQAAPGAKFTLTILDDD